MYICIFTTVHYCLPFCEKNRRFSLSGNNARRKRSSLHLFLLFFYYFDQNRHFNCFESVEKNPIVFWIISDMIVTFFRCYYRYVDKAVKNKTKSF